MISPLEAFHAHTDGRRCNGSAGYLAWIDHVLGIRETAHVDLSTSARAGI